MFKIVISDADLTLIKRQKLIDAPTFSRMLDVLCGRGIPFAVASGRTLSSLYRLFAPWKNRLLFFALDGACVYGGGTLLAGFPIDRETVEQVLKSDSVRGMELCAAEKSYLYTKNRSLVDSELRRIPDELVWQTDGTLPDEPVYKVIYFTNRGNGSVILPDTLHTVYQSETVTEAVRLDVDKRHAAEVICSSLRISPEEVLAYGDGENDRTMLEFAGTAVTVYGAEHRLFSITKHHTGNVARSVLDFLDGKQKF